MGVRHVVLLTWNDTATEQQKDAAIAALKELSGLVTGMRAYTVGPDLGVAGTHDAAIVADFDDIEAVKEYMAHPGHRAVVDEHLTPIMNPASRCQFAIEP